MVLVLPGSWQTSRQSSYSMLTRCIDEVHVFVDRDSQCIGEYAALDPLSALAQRWARDARKVSAAAQHLADADLIVDQPSRAEREAESAAQDCLASEPPSLARSLRALPADDPSEGLALDL